MKKLLAILLATLLIFAMIGCSSQEVSIEGSDDKDADVVAERVYENFKYDVNTDGELEITGYTYTGAKAADVTVPAEIEGRAIVGIGKDAFKAHKNIASVTLPNSIEYVDAFAFAECDYLTTVTLSEKITNIGEGAFSGCSALTNIALPATILELGAGAFKNCVALQSLALPEGLLTIDEAAFWGCSSLTNITIPTSVIDLGDGAFYGCKNLLEVTLLGNANVQEEGIVKMNAALGENAPETLAEANTILAEVGLHLVTLSDHGAKFVWDANENKIYGAFTAEEQTLLNSMNTILSKNDCASLDFVTTVLKAEGISLAQLNDCVKSDKFVWDADNKQFTTVFMGNAFDGCTANTIISVTDGSFFEKKAEALGYITIVPASNTTPNTKIFSNGELSFCYPNTLTMKINENGIVSLHADNFALAIVAKNKDLTNDHLTWDATNLNQYFKSYTDELTEKTIEQMTREISETEKLNFTKISFKRVADGAIFTDYLVTLGATTYLIETQETTVNAEIHNLIASTLIDLAPAQ